MRTAVIALVVGAVSLLGLAPPATAAVDKTTTARSCLIANDILCVNQQTTYEPHAVGCDFARCFVDVVDRISGSARLMAGRLEGRWSLTSPTGILRSSSCAWPGVTTTGCTVTQSFRVALSYISGGECKVFDLTSQGTAQMTVPVLGVPTLPLPVTSIKRDRVQMCVDGSGVITITTLSAPPPPPIPV